MTIAVYSRNESDFGLGLEARPIAYEYVLLLTDDMRMPQTE